MKIFDEVAQPTGCATSPLNEHGLWMSWSEAARDFLAGAVPNLFVLPPPSIVHLRTGEQYDITYSLLGEDVLIEDLLSAEAISFARGLASNWRPDGKIVLLTNLLNGNIDTKTLHYALALTRDLLVHENRDDFAALYSPLGHLGSGASDFYLHADLYEPEMLLNVFDDVPDDESGASIFLSVPKFCAILSEITLMPVSLRKKAISCLLQAGTTDRYNEFFSLLYNPENAWFEHVRASLVAEQLPIKLQRGEGYLIHDREWLHGRTAPNGGVGPWRLHRLVFKAMK
jgi:hypothetical protein